MEMENIMSNKRKHQDDSINHSEIEQIAMKKKLKKPNKNVRFDDVTVYYFPRSQGFVSVPSQGTVTLGMLPEHSSVEQYSVTDFSRLRHAIHKSILRERKLLPPSSLENDTDEDEPLPVDDYYFVQPIATRQRRTLLKQAGLVKIDASEKHELNFIRRSREICGCSCTRETDGCQPLTCECYLNGIACQVDRLTFPCPCATMLCQNPLGRLEFNQTRVRNHFIQTLTRLEAEREQEELESSNNSADNLIIIRCLLASIISQIEYEDDQIFSILHSLISSVDNPLIIPEHSSSLPLIIPSTDIDTQQNTLIPILSKEHSISAQRAACHQKSSIRRKPPATSTSSSSSSMTMISTELS